MILVQYSDLIKCFYSNTFSIQSAIGFGIGLGANVLARFALENPNKIYGLILVNCIARSAKWLEAFSIKVIVLYHEVLSFFF